MGLVSGQTAVGLAANPTSARVARRFVAEHLEGRGFPEGQIESCVLVASELVTNAILHAAGAIELRIASGPTNVRIEVEDGTNRMPHRRAYTGSASTGRGLALVESMSLAWGVERGTGGKTVWAELTA